GGRVVGPGELRHPQPVVPGLVLLLVLHVVVAAGTVQLLVQEADAGFVFDLLLIEAVGPVMVAAGLLGWILQVLLDVAIVQPGRALDAPVIERGADRLGVLETRDRVAAKATQPRDRLFSQKIELLIGTELADELVDLAQGDRERLAVPAL